MAHPSELAAVTSTSSSDAWAVGFFTTNSGEDKSLVLHWNGSSWSKVPSPNPGGNAGTYLTGVTQASPSDRLWAVGYYGTAVGVRGLFMYWDPVASAWVIQGSTAVRDQAHLTGVVSDTSSDAWAVGYNNQHDTTLTYRWTGSAWAKERSPNPGIGYNDYLNGAAVTSSANAWAVGSYASTSATDATLVFRWNGSSWSKVKGVPSPGRTSFPHAFLSGASAASATNAWSVGYDLADVADDDHGVALHWNGSGWVNSRPPNPATSDVLRGVVATSASNAWAVGFDCPDGGNCGAGPGSAAASVLILRWNGSSWATVT
jgi:hypothetical protein